MYRSVCVLFLLFATTFSYAQPDSSFAGLYSDASGLCWYTIRLTGRDGNRCFSYARESYDASGTTLITKTGDGGCTMTNGWFAVTQSAEADTALLLMRFTSDRAGNRSLTVHQSGKYDEVFSFVPPNSTTPLVEESPRDVPGNSQWVVKGTSGDPDDAVIDRSEEPKIPDPVIYNRKGGLRLKFCQYPNKTSFDILAPVSAACYNNAISGWLEVVDAAKHTYQYHCTLFDCYLYFEVKADRIIVTENRCAKNRPEACITWAGTYLIFHE